MHMFLELTYDRCGDVSDVVLEPDENEDPDELHNYAGTLRVTNPAIQFSDRAKSGEFNYYDDDEYFLMLNRIKEFSSMFFRNQPSINIFQLAAILSEYILKTESFAPIPEPEEEDIEEMDEDDEDDGDDGDGGEDMFKDSDGDDLFE